jgi:hypothetical protein
MVIVIVIMMMFGRVFVTMSVSDARIRSADEIDGNRDRKHNKNCKVPRGCPTNS